MTQMRGNVAATADLIRRTLRDANPALPVLSLRTFDEHLDRNLELWFVRAGAVVFSTFGGLALGLAVIGLYGVRAYTVARRTREMASAWLSAPNAATSSGCSCGKAR